MEKHIVITFSKGETEQALPMLQNIGGGRMISVHYEKPMDMVKKDRETGEPNELHGLVETKVTIQAQTNVSYTNKKRKTDPDFKAQNLSDFGQTYLDELGNPTEETSNVIQYKTGTKCFRVYPIQGGIKTEYFVNGKPATPEQIEIARRNKSGNRNRKSTDVSLMNIGLKNIKKIVADNQQLLFK